MCNPFLKETHVNTFKYCRHSVRMWPALGLLGSACSRAMPPLRVRCPLGHLMPRAAVPPHVNSTFAFGTT